MFRLLRKFYEDFPKNDERHVRKTICDKTLFSLGNPTKNVTTFSFL